MYDDSHYPEDEFTPDLSPREEALEDLQREHFANR